MVYVAVAELQPGHKPAEEASDSCVTQETPVVLSVHLSHRADQAPQKKDAPSFPCAGLHSHGFHLPSPSSFLNFLRDYRCCISSSYNQTISVPSPHHSASFLYSLL